MTECNGCGRCCSPVMLPFTQQDAARALPVRMDPKDRRWVMNDLIPIPRREGLARSEFLTEGGRTTIGFGVGGVMTVASFFFECKHYDQATRQCMAYDDRPPMCADYPWYGDPPDDTKAIPPECSFNEDLGRPVKLTRKENREVD